MKQGSGDARLIAIGYARSTMNRTSGNVADEKLKNFARVA